MLQYLVVKMFYLENEARGYFKAFRMSVCVCGAEGRGQEPYMLEKKKRKMKNEHHSLVKEKKKVPNIFTFNFFRFFCLMSYL